jgi:hypothetical protein
MGLASTEQEKEMLEMMYLEKKNELPLEKTLTPPPKEKDEVTLVFGGTTTNPDEPGLGIDEQMPVWDIDLYGNKIPENQLFVYPGAENDIFPTGKSLQADNAKVVDIDDKYLNLICYSGGADACLMYARDRLDKRKKIESMVLLGPTLSGEITEGVDIGDLYQGAPIWKTIMDDLIRDGTDIIVVNDSAKPELETYIPPVSSLGEEYGNYMYIPPDVTRPHWHEGNETGPGTNNSEAFREMIYDIIRVWQNK